MNERIKELADQCYYDDNVRPDGSRISEQEFMIFDKQKFAELIVRECIKSTLSLHDTAIDNQWNLDETFHVIVDKIVEDLDMQHIFRS